MAAFTGFFLTDRAETLKSLALPLELLGDDLGKRRLGQIKNGSA
jgi:hypothetical protein